jgi:hypothetical protein
VGYSKKLQSFTFKHTGESCTGEVYDKCSDSLFDVLRWLLAAGVKIVNINLPNLPKASTLNQIERLFFDVSYCKKMTLIFSQGELPPGYDVEAENDYKVFKRNIADRYFYVKVMSQELPPN